MYVVLGILPLCYVWKSYITYKYRWQRCMLFWVFNHCVMYGRVTLHINIGGNDVCCSGYTTIVLCMEELYYI